MPFKRISRKGEELISSTVYVPKKADDAYVNAATPKRSKSRLMVETLVANAPKK
jgi:hypothetical protein